MSIASDLANGLKVLEKELSQSFTWDGQTYPCVKSSLRRGTVVVVGGMEVEIALTIFIRAGLLPALPTTGTSKFTVDGKTYRVGPINHPSPGGHYEVDLMDHNR